MLVAVAGALLVPARPAFAIWCIGNNGVPFEVSGDECPAGSSDIGGLTKTKEGPKSGPNIANLIGQANAVLNTIVPFLVGVAVLIVIWGVFNYVLSAAEEEKRAEARLFIVWGIIFIFLMLSVWGFVNILVNSFSLSKQAPSQRPTLPEIPIPKA